MRLSLLRAPREPLGWPHTAALRGRRDRHTRLNGTILAGGLWELSPSPAGTTRDPSEPGREDEGRDAGNGL